jgi:glycosyltransferase involved in cell wall biosynthesis
MKLLFSAYSCCPCKTSEPGNAWRAINEALREHEVWTVIADAHGYREQTEAFLKEHPMPGFHPVFYKFPRPLGWMSVPGPFHGVHYHLWQERLCGLVRALNRQVKFDLTHHLTYGRYWSPSGLRALDLPFIWGPVGAAEMAPPSFVQELALRWRMFEFVRDHTRKCFERSRSLRATARAASIAIGVTRESCVALHRLGARRVEQMPQLLLTDEDLAEFGALPAPPSGPFRAICMGRNLHWKGFHLAIRAFAVFAQKNPDAELWIVNDGPFHEELQRIAARTNPAGQVKFLGKLPTYRDLLDRLAQTHVLMHPALHEAFGNVCLEALAAGRPVVCLDIGGPTSQVTPETGFAAPATRPDEAVAAMAGFLASINRDRGLLAKMSAAAREHVLKRFTMRESSRTMKRFYAEAVATHHAKAPS